VGFHDKPDPATLSGILRYFGDLGWIRPDDPTRVSLSIATLSCDGLGVVGALPDLPGVYLVGGFAARTQNFIFEVAHRLALGVVRGQGYSGLECFSTKRFI
jgi:hypothetical protein